ncbi:MAG TPA: beta-propeller domain-containing protein [Kofleriaceae bacterium]|nr:beta-propeller domain-containing protein [Kofleriaceae bacterium]
MLPPLASACNDGNSEPHTPWTASTQVALVQYDTCQQLEDDLKLHAVEELDALIEQYQSWGGNDATGGDGGDGAAPPATPGADGDSAGGRDEGTDYSGTNNQEDGVDEADLVKTDGYHVYLVNGNQLHVFDVPEFGQLVPASQTELEGYPFELLLDADGGRAAVFSFVPVENLPEEHPLRALVARAGATDEMPFRTWGLTKISIYGVEDSAAPALEREVWVEGWYQTARRTDNSVRVVTDGHILMPGLDDFWSYVYGSTDEIDLDAVREEAAARIAAADFDDLIPRLYERLPDGEVSIHSLAGSGCRSFYRPTDSAGRSTATILSFDLDAPELAIDSDTIISNWSTVYSSRDRLYLAESAWDWWWGWSRLEPGEVYTPSTNIHAFDVSGAGQASYVGSGRIEGTLFSQFALDEQDGLLRVAATTQPWRMWSEDDVTWRDPPPSESHIYVLEEDGDQLRTMGHLGGIAPQESIFAARFLADEAFLVTYEQVDPLFTIDLSNPRKPSVIGALEVPGFSTYLHPIADDRLLAIGVGGDENGATWNTQVSMFDVSNRASPSLLDGEELVSDGWGWSEALYEHKAFQYFEPKKLLAIPMSSYTYEGDDGQSEPWGPYIWHSSLELISVDADTGLERRGSIDHSRFFQNSEGWWGGADVRRSIFMGDYIYVISSRALTVNRLDDLSEVAAEELPVPTDLYWWW